MKKPSLKIHVAAGLLTLLTVNVASAAPASNEAPSLPEAVETLREQVDKLNAQNTRSCPADYRRQLPSSGPLRISIFYGYENFGDRTFDLVNSQAMARVLQEKCQGPAQVCGFKISRKTATQTQLTKTVGGQAVTINLYASSLTSFDNQNMNPDDKFWEQRKRSQAIKAHFYQELQASDVVFYGGHSRLGGGPSFEGQTLAQIGFNYLFKLPLRPILDAVSARPTKLKVLGLFSCSSNKYYRTEFERANPNLSLIVSHDEIESGEAEQMTIGALNSLLARKCAPEVKASLVSEQVPEHDVMEFIRK